jgi:hypothetical protein
MPRNPDPLRVWQARLDGVAGCIQGVLWTATIDQLTGLREDWPNLAAALDGLLEVLADKPTGRPLFDDQRAT